jgi:AcrR family transcriptional regulator
LTEQIKDIARHMFMRGGYGAVALHKIAAELEYTRPAIYRYFKEKDDLLVAIAFEDMEDLHPDLLQCADVDDPLARLLEMSRRNTAWAVEHTNHYLLFSSQAWRVQEDDVPSARDIPAEQKPPYLLYKAIEELIAQGRVKEDEKEPALAAVTLSAGIHDTILLEITMSGYDRARVHDRERPFMERLHAMFRGLMYGFLKEYK